jgi:hypothetical protein
MKKFDEIPAGMSIPAVFSCGENQRDLLARISLPMQHSLHFLGLLDFFLAGVEISSRDGFSILKNYFFFFAAFFLIVFFATFFLVFFAQAICVFLLSFTQGCLSVCLCIYPNQEHDNVMFRSLPVMHL